MFPNWKPLIMLSTVIRQVPGTRVCGPCPSLSSRVDHDPRIPIRYRSGFKVPGVNTKFPGVPGYGYPGTRCNGGVNTGYPRVPGYRGYPVLGYRYPTTRVPGFRVCIESLSGYPGLHRTCLLAANRVPEYRDTCTGPVFG
eukprot:946798-Rhodomonas_salina.2